MLFGGLVLNFHFAVVVGQGACYLSQRTRMMTVFGGIRKNIIGSATNKFHWIRITLVWMTLHSLPVNSALLHPWTLYLVLMMEMFFDDSNHQFCLTIFKDFVAIIIQFRILINQIINILCYSYCKDFAAIIIQFLHLVPAIL